MIDTCKYMASILFKIYSKEKTLNLDINYSPTEDSELASMRTSPSETAFHETVSALT